MKYKCLKCGVLLGTPEERKNHAAVCNEIPIFRPKPPRRRPLKVRKRVEWEILSQGQKELVEGLSVAYNETEPSESV